MECNCGSSNETWAVATFSIPILTSEQSAETLVEVLSEVRAVRGFRVNIPGKQIIVSYDSIRIDVPQLQEIIEKTGFSASAV
jgi:hypothetical protein